MYLECFLLNEVDYVLWVVNYVKIMLDLGFIMVCNLGDGYNEIVVLRNVISKGYVIGLCIYIVVKFIVIIGGYVDLSNGLFYLFCLDVGFK